MILKCIPALGWLILLPTGFTLEASTCNSDFCFQTQPTSGLLSGPAGSLIGYGYSITNPDPNLFLMTTTLDQGTFSNATVQSIFDFPIVGPKQSLFLNFDASDPSNLTGLFAIQWDANAAAGSSNSGAFVLSADFYNGDPLSGGTFVRSVESQIQGYTVTVSESVPEPSLTIVTAALLIGLCSIARKTEIRKARSADALARLITEDFYSTSRNGDLRDRNAALASPRAALPQPTSKWSQSK